MEECVISESKGGFSSRKCYNEVHVEQGFDTLQIDQINSLSLDPVRPKRDLELYQLKVVEKNSNGTKVLTRERWTQWLPHLLSRVFLPQGYPVSVSKDYMNYQIWDTLQKLFSGMAYPISAISVMASLGVGDVYASVVAATAIKNAKQITRGCGKIFFTWLLGAVMDRNTKKYRLMADVVYNTTLFLDLTTPLFPDYMIPFVFCLSGFILSFVDVTGQCTRLVIVHHQSRTTNSGDIAARDNSQEELLNLIAAAVTVPILFQLEDKLKLSIILFSGFAFCHLFCNYFGVSCLKMESLNDARLHICLKAFLKSGTVPRFEEVNRREQVILGLGLSEKNLSKYKIDLGCSFKNLLKLHTKLYAEHSAISKAFDEFQHKAFLILPDLRKRRISVLLHEGIKSEEILEAYVRSVFLGHFLIKNPNLNKDFHSALDPIISSKWELFRVRDALSSAGFHSTNVKLKCRDYRLTWIKS